MPTTVVGQDLASLTTFLISNGHQLVEMNRVGSLRVAPSWC